MYRQYIIILYYKIKDKNTILSTIAKLYSQTGRTIVHGNKIRETTETRID